jgi:ribulose kinase
MLPPSFFPQKVKGIGFDATCSLVVVDKADSPVPVGEEEEFNIIMWMDHRAQAGRQAAADS